MVWEEMCYPYREGGVGFISLFDVSKALFIKLWWNFREAANSLWGAYMLNKYCKKDHSMSAKGVGGSHV